MSENRIDSPGSALGLPSGLIRPPDLEIRVTVTVEGGETFLNYLLHSSAGQRTGFHYRVIRSNPIRARPEHYQAALLQEILKLHEGKHADGSLALGDEILTDLAALGRKLYRELFPPEMRAAYRSFRSEVETIQITSDEPWIPWELVKPYDDEAEELIDDDFLCMQFQLTRWLTGGLAPAAVVGVENLACIEAGDAVEKSPLPSAAKELRWLRELAARHPEVADRSLVHARYPQVKALLERGAIDLLHFVGHGCFAETDPDQSSFYLVAERPLRPLDLHGEIQTATKSRRPLVFLNACQVGQQSFSLTGLGGWAPRWVVDCGCGAFVAPLWTVNDILAHAFATTFYENLEAGRTFGQAAETARHAIRELAPSRPTWLAFAVYAHPNGRLAFGREEVPSNGRSARRPMAAPSTAAIQRENRLEADEIGDFDRGRVASLSLPQPWYDRREYRRWFLLTALLATLALSWAPRFYVPDFGPMAAFSGAARESSGESPAAAPARGAPTDEVLELRMPAGPAVPFGLSVARKEVTFGIEQSAGKGWLAATARETECRVVLDFRSTSVSQPEEMFSCELDVDLQVLIGGRVAVDDSLYEIKSAFTRRAACVAALRKIGERTGDRIRDIC